MLRPGFMRWWTAWQFMSSSYPNCQTCIWWLAPSASARNCCDGQCSNDQIICVLHMELVKSFLQISQLLHIIMLCLYVLRLKSLASAIGTVCRCCCIKLPFTKSQLALLMTRKWSPHSDCNGTYTEQGLFDVETSFWATNAFSVLKKHCTVV